MIAAPCFIEGRYLRSYHTAMTGWMQAFWTASDPSMASSARERTSTAFGPLGLQAPEDRNVRIICGAQSQHHDIPNAPRDPTRPVPRRDATKSDVKRLVFESIRIAAVDRRPACPRRSDWSDRPEMSAHRKHPPAANSIAIVNPIRP
jgi:hypothetical protein